MWSVNYEIMKILALNLFLCSLLAQHRNLTVQENRRGNSHVPLVASRGTATAEVRTAVLDVNHVRRRLNRPDEARQEVWSITLLFESQSGLYWWMYSTHGAPDPTVSLSDVLYRFGSIHIDQDAITSVQQSGPELEFAVSTSRAENSDEAMQKALTSLDQLIPEINAGRIMDSSLKFVYNLYTRISLVPPLRREFFELPATAFTPAPSMRNLKVSHEVSGWRVSFVTPNLEPAVVLIDNTLQKVTILEAPDSAREPTK